MKIPKEFECPRCGGAIPNDEQPGAYPGALSRWDNETYICSECGREEAMIQNFSDDKTLERDHSNWFHVALTDIVKASTFEEARTILHQIAGIADGN